ncbi:hypothetical protein ACSBR2_037988 [Camellia fascicularis]
MGPVGLCIVALVVISITHWFYGWRNARCNGKLPPGSMGMPLLGETLQFFAPNSSSDIPPFIKKRMERFGPIFRTKSGGTASYYINRPGSQLFCLPTRGEIVPELVPRYLHRDLWTTECGFLTWVYAQVPQEHGAEFIWSRKP